MKKIWLDDVEFIDIELCAMAPYADYKDLVDQQWRLINSTKRRSALMSDWDDESRG